ncbi:MAG TPA: hypothetical protein VI588_02730 [Candidatus Gracilibacteria bacterium]|nr:hypothetical protein [Candidatus Gracilibacteria bacterium]
MTAYDSSPDRLARLEELLAGLPESERQRRIEQAPVDEVLNCISRDAPSGLVKNFSARISTVMFRNLPHLERGRISHARGDFDTARQAYLAAYAEKDMRALLFLGQLLEEHGKGINAQSVYRMAMGNGCDEAYEALARLFLKGGDKEKAVQVISDAAQKNIQLSEELYRLAKE